MIWRGTGSIEPGIRLPAQDLPSLSNALTVSAWVRSPDSRGEAMQPLVSQWALRSALDQFDAYDAGSTQGLVTRGYYGAIFDGQYVYHCPIRSSEDRRSVHGHVLRYNTHMDFRDPAAYSAFDASCTDGLRTAGFYGSAFDGRYIYFIPRDDGHVHHSRFLRYDTLEDFSDPSSWSAHDAEHAHSFQGAAFDGRYIYCCPGFTKPGGAPFADAEVSSVVMRVDTASDFNDPDSYCLFDARSIHPQAACFDGAAFDGRHVYYAPHRTGVVLRFDTTGEFESLDSWQTFDATSTIAMEPNVGIVFDGRHLYFVPFGSSLMVRYDNTGDFHEPGSWSSHDVGGTLGQSRAGFKGGFFDGRYVYYIPFRGNYLRYDTAGPFEDARSWEARDAGYTDGLHTVAFTAGATDGRYLYAAPWRSPGNAGVMSGRMLRFDTLENGTFSLRYCDYGHNGGLCAAVPGPSFLINTSDGPFSVSAHRLLEPGWHRLAGTYDGKHIRLYVDGSPVASRTATGTITRSPADVAIGHIDGGRATFQGEIREIRVDDLARSDTYLSSSPE